MKTETFRFTVETAYGQPVSPALNLEASYDAFQNLAEVPQDEQLSEKELLGAINAKRKAAARAKKANEALEAAGYSKPETSVKTRDGQIAAIVRALVGAGVDRAVATKMAEQQIDNLTK